MQLPLFQATDRFSCRSCTHCCDQPWRTLIEADKAKALDSHDFSKYPHLAGKEFYSPAADGRDGFFDLGKGQGTRCLFLDADGLCIIHKELGAAAKPAMCRQFPYLPSRTWTDDRLAMNFGCPSVQQNKGDVLSKQKDDIATVVPVVTKAHKGAGARVPFDTTSTLSHEQFDALCDLALTIFDDAPLSPGERDGVRAGLLPTDIWTRFAALLSTLGALQEGLRHSPNGAIDDQTVTQIITDASSAPPPASIEAFSSSGAAPMAARMLFAATLHPDTLSAHQTGSAGVFQRMSRIPRLMALAQLSGAYASRVLARNVAIDDVLAHQVRRELEPAATRLLARYFRSRFWARMLVGTRLPIVAGVHQHIHDFNAILFFARAEAYHRDHTFLSEELIRQSLARVEFHIANQSRLYEQTMRGWLKSRLCDTRLAMKSLGLMAPRVSVNGVATAPH